MVIMLLAVYGALQINGALRIEPYRRVWLVNACTYNSAARKVGLIIQGALINQDNLQ